MTLSKMTFGGMTTNRMTTLSVLAGLHKQLTNFSQPLICHGYVISKGITTFEVILLYLTHPSIKASGPNVLKLFRMSVIG
jgi:hypothetical protein